MLALPSAFLTLPAAGDPRFPALVRKVHALALRRLLSHPLAALSRPLRAPVLGLREALVAAARRDRGAVLDRLASPDLLAPTLCLEAGVLSADAAFSAVGPGLLAALAAAGLLPATVMWEAPFAGLVLGDRAWRFDPPATAMAALPVGAEVQLADGRRLPLEAAPSTQPFLPLVPGLDLALLDTNPLAMVEAHPDKEGNALSLGGHPAEEWQAALVEALDLVQRGLPEWWAELPRSLARLVPVGFQPEVHLSASYREAPGLAYLTLHPNRLTLAEAVVHETQHSRLNCLSWVDPVLDNGWTEWTVSPVRPDLRPLMGVLLAVHAFVPVAALHARLADQGHPRAQGPDFARRRAQVLAGNDRGLEILRDKAQPTALGARLLAELEGLHAALVAIAPLPPAEHPPTLPPG